MGRVLNDHPLSPLASSLPLHPPKITPVRKVPGHLRSINISPTLSPPLRDPDLHCLALPTRAPELAVRGSLWSQAHSPAPGPVLYLKSASPPISSSSTTSSRKASPILLSPGGAPSPLVSTISASSRGRIIFVPGDSLHLACSKYSGTIVKPSNIGYT